ncbi:hypothetical protein [Peptoniphilus catoniae]|uniref:hypothetical protein n=1 Tax=Peptoniphilus catoniae TaxID=1660341 RepID=UPI0010FEEA1D|nr:hypothetical protein [Peptoniphilus catoniae]
MKRNGFTYIVTIVVISIIVTLISFLLESFKNNLIISSNEENNIQSQLYAESLINIALSEDSFKDKVKTVYFEDRHEIDYKPEDLIEDISNEYIKLSLDNSLTKKGFLMEASLDYKDIESKCFASGTIVNKIYLKGAGVLNSSTTNEEDLLESKEAFENINYKDFTYVEYIYLDEGDYFLEKDGLYFNIYKEEETVKENGDIGIVKTSLKKYPHNKSIYLKQDRGSLCIVDNIDLRGIVDVNKIYLNNNLGLKGIMILRNNIEYLDNPARISVEGITINFERASENNLISNYDFDNIDMYGKIIENFIKPELYNIKRDLKSN